MHTLVTGTKGQIARALVVCAEGTSGDPVAVCRPELDLTDPTTIERAIAARAPDLAIDAAGAEATTAAADGRGIPVIQISTADFPAKTQRPQNSRLHKRRIAQIFGFEAHPRTLETADAVAAHNYRMR